MEANSLFNTRQLTEYRSWPTGEKGCLFYVADAVIEKEKSQGAVFLIDAPWRKGDKVGNYDFLHQSEIETLRNLKPIAKGFAAFLLTQDSTKWIENSAILDTWWSSYYKWCIDKRNRSGFETEYILCECINWTTREKNMIMCYLYNPNMQYLYSNAMSHVIKKVIRNNTDDLNDIMRKWNPYILLSTNKGSSEQENMRYDFYSNAMLCGNNTYISGIQAMLLQFSAIRHATQEIGKAQNLDRIVGYILDNLSNNTQNRLTLNNIRVPEYGLDHAEKIYEYSWNINKERLEPLFRRDTSFYALSDREQELGFVYHLFRLELKHYKSKAIFSVLSPEEAEKMRILTIGYFTYLYKKLKGSRYETKVYKELELEFPELQRDKYPTQEVTGSIVQQVFNIQGDLVQGDQYISAHIEHVENFATGDNVQTKIIHNHE